MTILREISSAHWTGKKQINSNHISLFSHETKNQKSVVWSVLWEYKSSLYLLILNTLKMSNSTWVTIRKEIENLEEKIISFLLFPPTSSFTFGE